MIAFRVTTTRHSSTANGKPASLRTAIIAGAVAAQLAVAAAAGAADRNSRPVLSVLELREQNVIVQKFDLSCGAAALATVLRYQFGDMVTEKDVANGLIRRKEYIEHPEIVRIRQGFSLLDMKRYVDSRGYEGDGYGGLQLADLIRMAPVIVPISPIGYNHFVVFRGVLGNKVLVADPAFGNRVMELAKFERAWIEFPNFGRVGFVVTIAGMPFPPNGLAVRADEFATPDDSAVRDFLFHERLEGP